MYSAWTQVNAHVNATAERLLKICHENPQMEEIDVRTEVRVQQPNLGFSPISLKTLCPVCFAGPETQRAFVCIDGNFQLRTMSRGENRHDLSLRDIRDGRLFVDNGTISKQDKVVDAPVLALVS